MYNENKGEFNIIFNLLLRLHVYDRIELTAQLQNVQHVGR